VVKGSVDDLPKPVSASLRPTCTGLSGFQRCQSEPSRRSHRTPRRNYILALNRFPNKLSEDNIASSNRKGSSNKSSKLSNFRGFANN
jgi:hypothetical protein